MSQYLVYLNDICGRIASEIDFVFDGYDSAYSTKADKHAYKNQGVTMSTDINITNPRNTTLNQEKLFPP